MKKNIKNHKRELQRAEKRKQARQLREANKPAKQTPMTASSFISDFAGAAFEIYTKSEQMFRMIQQQIENVRKTKEANPVKWAILDPTPLVDVAALLTDENYTAKTKEVVKWAGELEDFASMAEKVTFVESKTTAMTDLVIAFDDILNKYQEAITIVHHMSQTILNQMTTEPVTVLDDYNNDVDFAPTEKIESEINIEEKIQSAYTPETNTVAAVTAQTIDPIISPVQIVDSEGAVKVEITETDAAILNEMNSQSLDKSELSENSEVNLMSDELTLTMEEEQSNSETLFEVQVPTEYAEQLLKEEHPQQKD